MVVTVDESKTEFREILPCSNDSQVYAIVRMYLVVVGQYDDQASLYKVAPNFQLSIELLSSSASCSCSAPARFSG